MVSEASLGDGWVRILEQQGGIRQARVASCMSVLPAVLPRGLCSLASGASGLGLPAYPCAEDLGSVRCPVVGSSPTEQDTCGALGGTVI